MNVPGRSFGPNQSVSTPPAIPKIHQGSASARCSPWPSSVWKMETAREGVSVMALSAEMIIEAAMVTANWR